ncbi:hypothetical protein GCM10028789_07060 [Sinomonas halotolerans]
MGVYNIPAGAPGYGPHLDADNDGIGCENAAFAYRPEPGPGNQVVQMPVGGAATGVTVESPNPLGAAALGGGLILAAVAGGTYVVRRANAGRG